MRKLQSKSETLLEINNYSILTEINLTCLYFQILFSKSNISLSKGHFRLQIGLRLGPNLSVASDPSFAHQLGAGAELVAFRCEILIIFGDKNLWISHRKATVDNSPETMRSEQLPTEGRQLRANRRAERGDVGGRIAVSEEADLEERKVGRSSRRSDLRPEGRRSEVRNEPPTGDPFVDRGRG